MRDLETDIAAVGAEVAGAFPPGPRGPLRKLEERLMARTAADHELRAAIFRFVDVAPACRSRDDLARHLVDHLKDVEELPASLRAVLDLGRRRPTRRTAGAAAAMSVKRLAQRFIAGEDARQALPLLGRLWDRGVASTLDLLGEDTLTRAEADDYGARCAEALRVLSTGCAPWADRPLLEADSIGPLPRANLSVKVTALTPLVRPHAPDVAQAEAGPRLRTLLRLARELGAHLHIDMESLDTRESVLGLVMDVLSEEEFARGPSAGIVIQAYLRDSREELERVLAFTRRHPREQPLVVRLVKGAYWDHEMALSRQSGWAPPVFTTTNDCDLNFERLTRSLLEARPLVRVAVASHNLRSVSHAIALNRALGGPDHDLELQVLRGLGDDLQHSLSILGFRVRAYCPVGELVEGMAYLVRRLLENTSNQSFLYRRTIGEPLERLLAPPRATIGSRP